MSALNGRALSGYKMRIGIKYVSFVVVAVVVICSAYVVYMNYNDGFYRKSNKLKPTDAARECGVHTHSHTWHLALMAQTFGART